MVPTARAGGAEAVATTLTARLPERGIETECVVLHGTDGGLPGVRSLGRRRSSDPRLVADLRRCLRVRLEAAPCVIVHTHLGWPLYHVRLAARGLNVVHVHTEHSTGNVRRRPVLRPFERRIYRGLATAFAVSDGVERALAAWLGDAAPPVEVVWNGAQLHGPCHRAPPDGRVRLVSVGSLTTHKGFDVALEAVALARARVEAYRLVGEGPERRALEERAASLGLDGVVEFVGWSDAVAAHLCWAHVLLAPSRREGFGLAAVEALSTGMPVIASSVDGLAEVLVGAGPAARLTAPDDAAVLATAIDAIAALPAEGYRALEAPAVRQAERFGIDAMVDRYAERYRVLTARRVGGGHD